MRMVAVVVVAVAILGGNVQAKAKPVVETPHRGAYAKNGEIHVNVFGTPEGKGLTTGHQDMKPSWSKDNGKLVFFRVTKFARDVGDWKTAICGVNAAGGGFRQLTSGKLTDYNPTWSRNGKNHIFFSRYKPKMVIYRTTAEANPGDEVAVSDTDHFEYSFSCLKDGRMFISSSRRPGELPYYLFKPGKSGDGAYAPVNFEYPVEGSLARVTFTADETKITYEYKAGWEGFQYNGRTLYIADFDVKTLTVSNPVQITDDSDKVTTLYPRWVKDASAVVYHSDRSGKPQIYMYTLKDRSTKRVSVDAGSTYFQPCGEKSPK